MIKKLFKYLETFAFLYLMLLPGCITLNATDLDLLACLLLFFGGMGYSSYLRFKFPVTEPTND